MSLEEWNQRLESLELTAPLASYRQLIAAATEDIQATAEYKWAAAFVEGRAMTEEGPYDR